VDLEEENRLEMKEGVRVMKMRFLDLVFKMQRRRRRKKTKKKRKEEEKEESM
jgi:hypothetical protein